MIPPSALQALDAIFGAGIDIYSGIRDSAVVAGRRDTMPSESDKVATTVRLPHPLYEEAKAVIERRANNIDTFNDLVVAALLSYLKLLRRREIDRAFAGMGEDTTYRKESLELVGEFEASDWEALELTEKADRKGG